MPSGIEIHAFRRSSDKGRERLTASLLAETLTAFDSRYKDFHLSELDMRGYLTGSIDLAFAADGKYWVIDWKTNKIDYRNNTPELYTPEAVNALMKIITTSFSWRSISLRSNECSKFV